MMVQPAVRHQMNWKKMTDTTALPLLALGSGAQPAGLVEIAVRLCLNQRKELCPHVWVPILKPQRPCLRPPAPRRLSLASRCRDCVDPLLSFLLDEALDDDAYCGAAHPGQKKRVVFADSKGLSLTAVRVFSEDQDSGPCPPPPADPPALPGGPGAAIGLALSSSEEEEDGYSCTVSTRCPGTRLQLGFPPPSADFQALRGRLARSMVVLESCAVLTEEARSVLRGAARVKNLSFHKDVRVRVTFDSWQSYRDVPCTYAQARYGGPQTDIFEFCVRVPKVLDAKRKIEFCLRYSADGCSQPFWDNNDGQNYSVRICVSSHQGKTATQ